MRVDYSGFRKRAINQSLMTRQLILSTKGSQKIHNTIGTTPWTFIQLWHNVLNCPALRWTALQWTSLLCNVIQYTSMLCCTLDSTSMLSLMFQFTCTGMHNIALQYNTILCDILLYTQMQYKSIQGKWLHFNQVHSPKMYVLHCSSVQYTVLCFTSLYCITVQCSAHQCTPLYCTSLHCTILHGTVLYCTVLYCTVLHQKTLLRS